MAQLYTQRQVTPDSWDMSGDPQHTSIALSVAATINYSADPSHPDTLPANTLALLPDGTSVSFDRTADVYVPYVIKGDATLRIIKESLLPTLTSDYAPLARVELHGIKPYQPEPYLAAGALGSTAATTVSYGSATTARALQRYAGGGSPPAPPAAWYTTGYDDSGWPAATGGNTSVAPPTGAAWLWPENPPPGVPEDALFRQWVALPTGTITAATLTIEHDDAILAAYVNGTALPGAGSPPSNPFTLDVAPADLVAGARNLLALWAGNRVMDTAGLAYVLAVTFAGSGDLLAIAGPVEGDLAVYEGGAWRRLPVGANGTVLTSNGADPSWATAATGSVTSVAFSGPTGTSVSGSPITSSGTIALSWASQSANTVLGAPNGSSGAPTFRALVGADIPVDASTIVSSAGEIKGNYQAGSGVTISGNTISATGSGGTVTSITLSMPGIFSVSPATITSSGTFSVTLANESANTVLAGPASGSAAAPTFRAVQPADLPTAPTAGGHIHAHGHFL